MRKFFTILLRSVQGPVVPAALLGVACALVPELVLAQYYNGPGIEGGLNDARAIGGLTDRGVREIILDLLYAVLAFMGLAAVVVIVVAGIYLVVSFGEESAKDKAKKMILYAVIGLLVILLASAIVRLIDSAVTSSL